MIDLNYIRGFFPQAIAENAAFQKHILKEYVELLALEWMARSPFSDKLVFIGGTNLRLIQGIDRFSEDLDFDCKNLNKEEFLQMTDQLMRYLQMQGLRVETRDSDSAILSAFRRSIYFPELLFSLQLTGHRDARFLMKIEAQDQGVDYPREMATVKRMGFFFPIAAPPMGVLLSMKLAALLTRQKGRDFYDVIFLWQRTAPDYDFLSHRVGIADASLLLTRLQEVISNTNLSLKQRDFEHLLFDPHKSEQILHFLEIVKFEDQCPQP